VLVYLVVIQNDGDFVEVMQLYVRGLEL